MRGTVTTLTTGTDAAASALTGRRGKKSRVGRRRDGAHVMLSVVVPTEVRERLHEIAAEKGVSIADYIANAIAQPERLYDTAALRQAKPLSDAGYRLSRLIEALQSADIATALQFATEVKAIIHSALAPLAKAHRAEVASKDVRVAGGWEG